MELILASVSPRRREILSTLNLKFSVMDSHVNEHEVVGRQRNMDPFRMVRLLSREKAKSVAEKMKEGLVLGADTVVVLDQKIFGKPSSHQELREMFALLSGRTHQVITGITMIDAALRDSESKSAMTEVTFRAIEPVEIDWYQSNAFYRDKAGGYAIQGLAAVFVKSIHGCYYNVVGLPIQEVLNLFPRFGMHWQDFVY